METIYPDAGEMLISTCLTPG